MACRECGCTAYCACTHEDLGACWWVEEDLCSACAPDSDEDWEHPPAEVVREIAGG
jgi:hypothetical protein